MAILIDFSQIYYSAIYQQVDYKGNLKYPDEWNSDDTLTLGLLRHVVLTSILAYKRKFSHRYGEMIFCWDADYPWRKQLFKHYKYRRQFRKRDDCLDWGMIDRFKKDFKKELQQDLGYSVMSVPDAEADDIIGVLCKHLQEDVLILSSDKDFMQLQKYPRVVQYSPNKKDYLECDKPRRFLFDHIIRGDGGDDIPNIFSSINSFYNKTRCKPCFTKKIEKWLDVGNPTKIVEWDEATQKRFKQNRKLIDLDCIPSKLEEEILECYLNRQNDSPNRFEYLVKNGLSDLLDSINEF